MPSENNSAPLDLHTAQVLRAPAVPFLSFPFPFLLSPDNPPCPPSLSLLLPPSPPHFRSGAGSWAADRDTGIETRS